MDDHEQLISAFDRDADFAQLQMLQRQLADRGNRCLETAQQLAALRAKLDQALADLSQRPK